MRVAVLGSWRGKDQSHWGLRETPDEFRAACRRVGADLIARGHSLIVGTDAEHTADGNAALGAIDALKADGGSVAWPRIMLIRPMASKKTERRPFEDLRRSLPGAVVEFPVDAASWAVVKLVQTQLADALILIGGAEKTEQAGLTAAVSRKPLACIGSFGGAAALLNTRFTACPTSWGYEPYQTSRLPELQEPFSEQLLHAALEAAWIQDAPKLMIIHGRSQDHAVLKTYLEKIVKKVIVLADEFAPTQPIPLKFERFASSVDGAIALLTPDDVGALGAEPAALTPRARENVWVEVGWFWGHRGRSKLLLLTTGGVTIPSDLGNVETYAYREEPMERDVEIQRFIATLRSASDAARVMA